MKTTVALMPVASRNMDSTRFAMIHTSRDSRFSENIMGVSWWDVCCGSLLLVAFFLLLGCGSNGYAGGNGITALSSSALTIDASQSIPITATVSPGLTVNWSLTTSTCMSESWGCGTLSSSTGTTVTYSAPASIPSPITALLVASVFGGSSQTTTITVNPDPTITAAPPSGVVGQAYSTKIVAAGGTAPLNLSLSAGNLPAGLTFNAATGVISGTPTAAGTFTVNFRVVDSSAIPFTVSAQTTITITAAAMNIITVTGNPPAGTVNATYSTQLAASGGSAPYTWSVISGALPADLSLSSSTGAITGTPSAVGTYVFTVQAQDSTGLKGYASFGITVTAAGTPLSLTMSTLPNGTVGVAYSAVIGVTGGASPYNCVITSGTLPSGLALGPNCLVSGNPAIAGTVTVQLKVTDSSSPQQIASGPETITITPANSLSLTTGTLPNGTVNVAYSATIGVMGGTAPYSCAILSGSLPAGLGLGANCLVSGTPTTAGTVAVQVRATDSSSPTQSVAGPETITIGAAPLSLGTGTLPNGTVGVAYSATVGVTGGTSPYGCSIVSGTLPSGLVLAANCLVSGTPTTAGTTTLQVKATDSSSPQQTLTGPETITINPATATIVISSPPPATLNQPYTGTIPITGGTGPYTCALQSGTLPSSLTLDTNCTVTGTPTNVGSTTVSIKATDSSSPTNATTGPITITVNGAGPILTLTPPPPATVGDPYTGTIVVTGGTGPYTCVLASGTLPAGLSLASNCVISGTPTTPGAVTLQITATDSSVPPVTTTGPVTITVNPTPKLAFTGSLPNAIVGVSYSQTLQASGGIPPYTYSITAGALPVGLTLSSAGVVSGTPTAAGAVSFTVTATDSEKTPQTASLSLVLVVVYPSSPNDSELNGPYAFLFQAYDDEILGVLNYQTATAGSFTADGTGVVTTGEQDSNHQTSNPAGNIVITQGLIGAYTIGTDNRGFLTLSTINTDGTIGTTTTYAISVKLPVSPATTSVAGSLIEYDDANLVGTKGSGTFLQQVSTATSAGLSGGYAFGLQGDTPCLPTCTIGIVAGPVASVGAFNAGAGGEVSGTSDANIGATKITSSTLSGSYTGADSNGRVELSMATSNTLVGAYPQDYAVYIVDANNAFILSTDKHSSYLLLAGSAQKQAASTFTAYSMSGGFVGYENSPTNPGLVGATLQNVLNLSTATVFRSTADGAGTCTTTNVDQGGTTGLVNGLTGLGSGSAIISALLGTYASTGNSACSVTSIGRVVFNYPPPTGLLATTLQLLGLGGNPPAPRVVYLSSINRGYFLETGYAGLGNIEQQVGSPFTVAGLKGTLVYGTTPAASVASTDSSGYFTADGSGNAHTTLDLNVGIGNVNLLQLGTSTNYVYTLTDPTAGRYLLGASTVIYAISPSRYVLLDTDPLETSPTVNLIY